MHILGTQTHKRASVVTLEKPLGVSKLLYDPSFRLKVSKKVKSFHFFTLTTFQLLQMQTLLLMPFGELKEMLSRLQQPHNWSLSLTFRESLLLRRWSSSPLERRCFSTKRTTKGNYQGVMQNPNHNFQPPFPSINPTLSL